MIRKGKGIFSLGNIMPLNNIVGRNNPISDMNIAVCCELVEDDISRPKERQVKVNRMLSQESKSRFPLIGTSRTKTLSNKILAMFTVDSNR